MELSFSAPVTVAATSTIMSFPSTQSPPPLVTPHPETFIKLCLLWTALHRTASFPPACHDVVQDQSIMQIQNREDLGKLLKSLGNPPQSSSQESMFGGGRMMMMDPELEEELNNHLKYQVRYTSRTLSVIGVLGGIVLILIVVAFTTCIRTRKNMMENAANSGHEVFGRQVLIDQIRQLSNSSTRGNNADHPPPAYDDVVKDDLEEEDEEDKVGEDEDLEAHLPSYLEAIEAMEAMEAMEVAVAAAASSNNSDSVDNHVVTIEVNHGASTSSKQNEVSVAAAVARRKSSVTTCSKEDEVSVAVAARRKSSVMAPSMAARLPSVTEPK